MTTIKSLILVLLLVKYGSAQGSGYNMTCMAQKDDPHQCATAGRTQKCYVINGQTKCNVTVVSCGATCCAGWKFDMKAKCTIPIKNYVCTEPHLNTSTAGSGRYCEDVTQCQGEEVCCSNRCTAPVYHDHCWYTNLHNTRGETNTTTNDICNPCKCKTDSKVATMTCFEQRCNWDNQTDVPENYNPPVIYTPTNRITVYVLKDRNEAYLDKETFRSIFALNYNGNDVPVSLSKTVFQHCLCPKSTDTLTIRTDYDRFGNSNTTEIKVDIIDMFPPEFHDCPGDQQLNTNDKIYWTDPSVTDNVGVQELYKPTIPRQSNNLLTPGIYNIIYKAVDWSNNVATCSFILTVLATPKPPLPKTERHNEILVPIIIGSCVGSAAVVTLAFLVGLVLYRLRTKQSQSFQVQSDRTKTWTPTHCSNKAYGALKDEKC